MSDRERTTESLKRLGMSAGAAHKAAEELEGEQLAALADAAETLAGVTPTEAADPDVAELLTATRQALATKEAAVQQQHPAGGSATRRPGRRQPRATGTTASSTAAKRPRPDTRDGQGRQRAAGKATPPATVAEPDAPSRYSYASDGGVQRDAQGRVRHEGDDSEPTTYGEKRRRTRSRDAHGRKR